jgi:hypothetical protein
MDGDHERVKLPQGVRSWGQLVDHPECAWPWPYSESELLSIGNKIPAHHRDRALTDIVREARRYLTSFEMRRRGDGKKENPEKELRRLQAALNELLDACEGLGADAIDRLRNTGEREEGGRPHFSINQLMCEAYGFRYSNPGLDPTYAPMYEGAIKIESIDNMERKGRPRGMEGILLSRLEKIFIAANSGERPQGWPDFRDACTEPIHKMHGRAMPAVDPKTKQGQLLRQKTREIEKK